MQSTTLSERQQAKDPENPRGLFQITGAKLWNQVRNLIRQKTSLDSFKAALTKYLLLLQDHPPIPGISSSNSLRTILASGGSALGAVEDDGGWEVCNLMAGS